MCASLRRMKRRDKTYHHKKKKIACIQVTSQSTKVPLYSAMSLVYKGKLICGGVYDYVEKSEFKSGAKVPSD
jgi:hypothetical protein